MKGTKPRLVIDNDAVVRAPSAPSWLSREAKTEWRRVIPGLVKRRVLTSSDLGTLENYCVATGRVRQIERRIQQLDRLDLQLARLQIHVMATARQHAAELGLTPVSRSRPTIREEGDDEDLSDLDL
ncbi:phage terminase small subunit P27 family [Xanthobacter autotrophicus]|uniref:phage terminase small subunit P27 family n=1 Tax=Xanthobacter autotrophicus TaxID=280 RepID=UPI0037277942